MTCFPVFLAENQTLLAMRLVLGDERTAEFCFDVADPTSSKSVAFARRHSNQMATLIDARFAPDETVDEDG